MKEFFEFFRTCRRKVPVRTPARCRRPTLFPPLGRGKTIHLRKNRDLQNRSKFRLRFLIDLGCLVGAILGSFFALLASWIALGSLRSRKKILPNGSWPLQEEFQDRFQPSWGPKGSQREPKRVQNGATEPPRERESETLFFVGCLN